MGQQDEMFKQTVKRMNTTTKTLQIIYEFFTDRQWVNQEESVAKIHAEELEKRLKESGVLKV